MSNTKEVTYLLGTTYRQVKMHWMCDHNVKMPITDVAKKQLAQKRRLFSRICLRCGRKNPISSSRCRGCKSEDLRLKNRSIGVKK